MPLLFAKKEVFKWLAQGLKTIDVRKGNRLSGDIVVFRSGPQSLTFRIVKSESGELKDILRLDNFRAIIPSAVALGDAVSYVRNLYGGYDGVFTAYYIEPIR